MNVTQTNGFCPRGNHRNSSCLFVRCVKKKKRKRGASAKYICGARRGVENVKGEGTSRSSK